MEKIIINNNKLTLNDVKQKFYKVRAIVENENGEIAISIEDGKCIFPGGKCKFNEDSKAAILREIKEELGIEFSMSEINEAFVLETYYKDFYNYRTNQCEPRYTNTIYYYFKTDKIIDKSNQNLTQGEIKLNFNAYFVSKEELRFMLMQNHENAVNGKYFDEENRAVLQYILNKEEKQAESEKLRKSSSVR